MKYKLNDIVKKSFKKKQNEVDYFIAQLGDGNNVVKVPNKPNYVYYRVNGVVGEAENYRVALSNDRWVMIGKDPSEPSKIQVLSFMNSRRNYGDDDKTLVNVENHAKSHQYPESDTVFVQLRQIMPLRVTPNGGFVINVYRGIIKINNVAYIVDTQNIDLSDYVIYSDTGTRAKWLKIECGAAGVNVVEGAEVAFADLLDTEFPATSADHAEIAVIRIWSGQKKITETRKQTDIIDLRFSERNNMYHNMLSGVQGGSVDEYYHATFAEYSVLQSTSGINSGDQDLSSLALKNNVLELDNTTAFVPDADYEPATKKYVDDSSGVPAAHAASHVNGTDDIQNATASQNGLATAAQITKLDAVDSGTWTPTGTAGVNVDSVAPDLFQYLRVGSIVFFSGVVVVNQTAVGESIVYLSLPIASNFTLSSDANGNATQSGSGIPNIGNVREDQTENRLEIDFYGQSAGDIYYRVVGSYIVK